jgi:hypothetical protein
MRTFALSSLALLASTVVAIDITHELNSGWRMGLRPRQASVQNLQTFGSAIGGARASAVRGSHGNERSKAPVRLLTISLADYQLGRSGQAIRGGRGYLRTCSTEGDGTVNTSSVLTCPAAQNDFPTAANRACDNQKNKCAELANSGAPFEVGDCDRQSGMSPRRESGLWNLEKALTRPLEQCKATINTAPVTSFAVAADPAAAADPVANAEPALVSSDAQYDFFCEL